MGGKQHRTAIAPEGIGLTSLSNWFRILSMCPGPIRPFALRRDWLFIGGFQHPPNIDAVLFFVKEIYPLVSEHLRDAKFYIIGDKAPA